MKVDYNWLKDFVEITAPPQENFSLHEVHDFRLGWSRAAKDITLADASHQTV